MLNVKIQRTNNSNICVSVSMSAHTCGWFVTICGFEKLIMTIALCPFLKLLGPWTSKLVLNNYVNKLMHSFTSRCWKLVYNLEFYISQISGCLNTDPVAVFAVYYIYNFFTVFCRLWVWYVFDVFSHHKSWG